MCDLTHTNGDKLTCSVSSINTDREQAQIALVVRKQVFDFPNVVEVSEGLNFDH